MTTNVELTGLPARTYLFETLQGSASIVANTQAKPWNFPRTFDPAWTVFRSGIKCKYTLTTVSSGVTSIGMTETVREAIQDALIGLIQIQSPALGLIVNNIPASRLRRLQRDIGLVTEFDLEPGLNQNIPISGTSSHTGYITIAHAADLPHDSLRSMFAASAAQWNDAWITLTFGSLTFTDSNGVVWTFDVANTTIRYFVTYAETSRLRNAHPICYEYLQTTDNQAILPAGAYLCLNLWPGSTNKTPRFYGWTAANGIDMRIDGVIKRDPNMDGLPEMLAELASEDVGYQKPYTIEYPLGWGRMDMRGIPVFSLRRDGFRYSSIPGGQKVVPTLQSGNGYGSPLIWEWARVPYVTDGMVVQNPTPAMIPDVAPMPLPPGVALVLPKVTPMSQGQATVSNANTAPAKMLKLK